MRPLPWILFAMALAAVLGLCLHTRDLAERLGRHEIRLRQTGSAAARAAERAALVEQGLREKVAGLEQRLEEAIGREQEVLALLEQRVEAERAAREAQRALRDEWSRPMPEGVRMRLLDLHDCLSHDGYPEIRFLRAMGLDDEGLHDVEVMDHDPQRMTTTLFLADRMTATLDRGEGTLELRFFDGHRVADGSREELPEEGFALTLESVDGPLWESRLPMLVQVEGAYPDPGGSAENGGTRSGRADAGTRMLWQDRLDTLLEFARYNDLRLRIPSFLDLEGPWFHDVALLGYDEKKLLTMAASAERLAVEVDKDAGVVNLLLKGGTLRRKGGDSAISPDGMRLLLDRVTPQRASEIMLGKVVRR